jgi:PIN domain nuclease of toxin-antitoxin system
MNSPLYLLDTHVWLWLLAGEEPLKSSPARSTLETAVTAGQLRVSVVSVWEVGMLEAKGLIGIPIGVDAWVQQALAAPGIAPAPLTPQVAVSSTRLPGQLHGDPADRILVATARALGAHLVTRDARLLEYAAAGHVLALAV